MGFPILVRYHLYIESGPWCLVTRSSLNQLMACCQFGIMTLLESMLQLIVNWTKMYQSQWNFNQNTFFSQTNAFKNVISKLLTKPQFINSLWHGNALWQQRSEYILAQMMAYWLMAPSHWLNHCWLMIKGVPWHLLGSNFTRSFVAFACVQIYRKHSNEFEIHTFKSTTASSREQWVKLTHHMHSESKHWSREVITVTTTSPLVVNKTTISGAESVHEVVTMMTLCSQWMDMKIELFTGVYVSWIILMHSR